MMAASADAIPLSLPSNSKMDCETISSGPASNICSSQGVLTVIKSVLGTGGAGFVGSRLVRSYLEDGIKVRVVDSLKHGSLENLGALTCGARVPGNRPL
jgi:hypothetical protein